MDSAKMYKDRLRKWGTTKNIKSNEMEAIIRKQAQRSLKRKKSAFWIHNSEVSEQKIIRVRKKRKLSDVQALRLRATTPPGLICYTPLNSPLTTPRVLETPERVAKLVRDYIRGSFDSKIWRLSGVAVCTSKEISMEPLTAFQRQCDHARASFVAGKPRMAWQLLNLAMEHVGQMVSGDYPQIYDIVTGQIKSWVHSGLRFGSCVIADQFSAMSAAVKGSGHPVHQVFTQLKDLDESSLMHTLNAVLEIQLDLFTQTSGPFSCNTLEFRLAKLTWKSKYLAQDTTKGYLVLLQEVERTLGPSDRRSFRVRLCLCHHYLGWRRWKEAAACAQRIIALGTDANEIFLEGALYLLAVAQFRLLEMDLAEQSIRQAIAIQANKFGVEDDVVLRYMSILESWLNHWNRADEAAEVRQRWEAILDRKHMRLLYEDEKRYQKCLTSGKPVHV